VPPSRSLYEFREDLHQLVEQLDAGDLGAAQAALRGLVLRSLEPVRAPQRRFRFFGGMEAEPDLAERSGQTVREEFGHGA
jgi:hypothetical protein